MQFGDKKHGCAKTLDMPPIPKTTLGTKVLFGIGGHSSVLAQPCYFPTFLFFFAILCTKIAIQAAILEKNTFF